jgi:hypothetical protein
MTLSDRHLTMLRQGSGISDEVIAARGYRTASNSAELLVLGFAKGQTKTAQIPGLIIPIYSPDGQNSLYQYRPDNSRVEVQRNKPLLPDGTRPNKVIKYETPQGAQLKIDCPLVCHAKLADVDTRLFITEGIKKSDALAARGECVIGLLGVWNWRDKQGPLPDWEYVPLKGRQVVICYDNDISIKSSVYQAMLRLKRFLESRGAIVKVVYLPKNNGEKLGIDDFLAQGHSIDELFNFASELRTPDPVSRLNEAVKNSSNPDLPGVLVSDRQLRDTVKSSLDALTKRNHPAVLFVRTGRVVRLVRTERETPQIEDVPLPAMRVILSQAANFFTVGREKLTATHPPRDVAEGILNLGEWPFPPLLGVVTCPQVRSDGSLLTTPGYDAVTRVIYAPLPGLTIGTVPMTPTAEDVRRAVELALEPFDQFPFVGDADRANFIGLLLTPVMRTAIRGPVPLAVLTATTPGSGKGLLARSVIRLETGSHVPFANWPEDDTELRKFVTSSLRAGGMFTVFDNVSRPMRSDVFSQALTCEVWQDRLLGGNVQVELPNRPIWIATGNNIEVDGDLARRCYRIALDANLPRPWERDGFTHHDLITYLSEKRGELLGALLTLAQAWYAAGCPEGDIVPMGSFEDWSRIVGSVLQCAGIMGFLGNRADLYADGDAKEWGAFLCAWYSRYTNKPQVLGTVVAALTSDPAFAATLPGDLQDTMSAFKGGNVKVSPARRLGKALKRVEGRPFGTNEICYRAQKVWDSHRTVFDWFVICGNSAGYAGHAERNPAQTSSKTGESDSRGVVIEPNTNPDGPENLLHTPHTLQQAGQVELEEIEL